MFEGLIPGVQSVPNKSQKYKCGIRRFLENQLPVHALACISDTIAKVFGLGNRMIRHIWMIGNDGTTIVLSPNKVNG